MAGAAVTTAAFWVDYFTKGRVRTADDPVYVGFEDAFPLADGYMSVCYLAGAALLWKGRPAAVPTGISAGSAMVFLGLMDVLFNLEHGKYREMNGAMATEAAINAASLILGPFTIARLWRIRHRLGA